MTGLIAAALLLWGVMLDVVWHDGSQDPAYDNVAVYGWVLDGPGCEMWTTRLFNGLTEAQQLGVVTHEIGHCLGLEHTDEDSIMRDGTYWMVPLDRDVLEMRRGYGGLKYRTVIGGIAK